jgi:hypothetical protein
MAKTIAEDLKWRIILLYNDGYSKKDIAKLLYIGVTLVKKVIHIYAKWGCVVNPWRRVPGRKKIFSRADMNVRTIELFEILFIANIIILLFIRYYVELFMNMLIFILMSMLKKCGYKLENRSQFQHYGDHWLTVELHIKRYKFFQFYNICYR